MTSTQAELQNVYDDVAELQEKVAALENQMSAVEASIASMGVITLTENTDLFTLGVGRYLIPNATVSATISNKPITSTYSAFVEVVQGGDAGQKTIYYAPCTKDRATYYHAAYYQNEWGAWNTVDLMDSGWIDLPLATGITAYSETQKPRYRKIGKEVFISGVIKGITANDTVIGTLPEGYRPSKKVIFAVGSVGQIISRLSIETNGDIYYNRSTIEPIVAENYHSVASNFSID